MKIKMKILWMSYQTSSLTFLHFLYHINHFYYYSNKKIHYKTKHFHFSIKYS
jgi:hypothetical protein